MCCALLKGREDAVVSGFYKMKHVERKREEINFILARKDCAVKGLGLLYLRLGLVC